MTITPDQIPQRWEDVTPDWMTAALAATCPGAQVSDVRVTFSDSGNNRRARLALQYAHGSGPAQVFAKAEGQYRETHAKNGNMFGEADLFASGASLAIDHPLPYHVVIDREGLDYVLVMEDVTARGADPRDAARPLTPDQAANGLRGLASLHSQYWDFTADRHPELAWVRDWAPDQGFLDVIGSILAKGIADAGERLPEQIARSGIDTLMDDLRRYIVSLGTGHRTLLHGDAHVGNTYLLPDDSVGFLDWPVVRRGNWSMDVGYFLVSALTVEDRRAHDADLIEVYRAALDVPDGQRPSGDEAWLRYRASPAFGLPVWLATLSAETSQPVPICLLLAERYGAAFAELDATGALDQLIDARP